MRLTIKTKTGKIIHKFYIYVPDISKPQKEKREIFFEDLQDTDKFSNNKKP